MAYFDCSVSSQTGCCSPLLAQVLATLSSVGASQTGRYGPPPLPKGAPLHVGDPPTHLSDFVIQFDGGAYRDLKIGGAGVILWRHTHGALEPLDSLGIPIYPCANAAHAEACGAAHAVLLAAKHYPKHQPSQILIKGDNRTVI